MNRPISYYVLVLGGLILAGPAMAIAEDEVIWKAAEKLLQSDAPPPPARQQAHAVDLGQPYLFESFAQWSPEEIQRAVALLFEKQLPAADSVAPHSDEAAMGEALERLFEYYPLVARTAQDFAVLRNWIFDPGQPAPLRMFLLERAAPGSTPSSAFANYFQGHLTFDEGTFQQRLLELIQLPQESKPVQRVAIDTLLAQTREGYQRLLQRDPQVARQLAEGTAVSVQQLIEDPKAIAMTRRTEILLERYNATVGRWASSLKGTADNPQRNASVRAKAQESLETILREFPVPNRTALETSP